MTETKKAWWERLLKTSSLIGLSKVAGFARDLLVAAYFGTSKAADAFNFAYLFTGNIFILLGGLNGPFHSATVATLSKLSIEGSEASQAKQNRFISQILFNTGAVFALLSFVLWLLAKPILGFILKEQPALIEPTCEQLIIMLPVFGVAGSIGVLLGAVSFKGDYFWPSLSPLISSLTLILFVVLGYPTLGASVLGLGTTLGALLQLLVQFADLWKYGFRFQFTNHEAEANANFNSILFPALLSSTIGSLNVYVDSFFSAGLQPGSWTAILIGNRLIQLPFGILVGASLVSFLPRIAALKDNLESFKSTLKRETINLFILLVPVTSLMLALAKPGIQILFERGAFDHNSTALVEMVLLGLAGSILTALPREIYTRAYYALGDSKTPMFVSLFSIVWNALLDWWLGRWLGVMGIALSTTLTALINSALLDILLTRKIGSLHNDWPKLVFLLAVGALVYFVTNQTYLLLQNSTFLPNLNFIFDFKVFLASLLAAAVGLGIYFGFYKLFTRLYK